MRRAAGLLYGLAAAIGMMIDQRPAGSSVPPTDARGRRERV